MKYPIPTRSAEVYIKAGAASEDGEYMVQLIEALNDAYFTGLHGEEYGYRSVDEVEKHFAAKGYPHSEEIHEVLMLISNQAVKAYEQGRIDSRANRTAANS